MYSEWLYNDVDIKASGGVANAKINVELCEEA
jgi:hypothetical protein